MFFDGAFVGNAASLFPIKVAVTLRVTGHHAERDDYNFKLHECVMLQTAQFEGTRSPAVAGLFYPRDPLTLRWTVQVLLDEAGDSSAETSPAAVPKAIIVPHAGYAYSGPVAASGYVRLLPGRDLIKRVILLGPAHRYGFRGLAVAAAARFATPLGAIDVDLNAVGRLLDLPTVQLLDPAHAREHSLEVHLPFLQVVLSDFQLVPIVVGQASAVEVADVLRRLWGGPETCIVISSDLSHFHDDAEARTLDRETSQIIEAGRGELLGGDRACGYLAIQGLLQCAREYGIRLQNVDLRNSSQFVGSPERVVGYGAYVAESVHGTNSTTDPAPPSVVASSDSLNRHQQRFLLRVAVAAIRAELKSGKPPKIASERYSPEFRETRATFVTLKQSGELRGCVGSVQAVEPLVVSVGRSAGNAAFRDCRFAPLAEGELPGLNVQLSILSPAVSVAVASEEELFERLRPNVDGLILREGPILAVFLPSVWNEVDDPVEFVRRLKLKGGWPADYWSESISVDRFTVSTIAGRIAGLG